MLTCRNFSDIDFYPLSIIYIANIFSGASLWFYAIVLFVKVVVPTCQHLLLIQTRSWLQVLGWGKNTPVE
jgi:hypothetical protein